MTYPKTLWEHEIRGEDWLAAVVLSACQDGTDLFVLVEWCDTVRSITYDPDILWHEGEWWGEEPAEMFPLTPAQRADLRGAVATALRKGRRRLRRAVKKDPRFYK